MSLAGAAVHSLIQLLPSGTAFCIGVVLIVMMTGRLVHHKGSLARAVLPLSCICAGVGTGSSGRWSGARCRSMPCLIMPLPGALPTCLVEPVRVGCEGRELVAIDTSTIVRLRAGTRPLAGKGFCHRAGRAVRANIVAAAASIVMIGGVRVGIVRRTRFGARCEDAVETLFHALPPSACKRLIVVDAGIATQGVLPPPRTRRRCWGGCASTAPCGVPHPHPAASEVIRRGTVRCCIQAHRRRRSTPPKNS